MKLLMLVKRKRLILVSLLKIEEYLHVSASATSNPHRTLIKGNISSDGIIDDDFESELAGHESNVNCLTNDVQT